MILPSIDEIKNILSFYFQFPEYSINSASWSVQQAFKLAIHHDEIKKKQEKCKHEMLVSGSSYHGSSPDMYECKYCGLTEWQ